MKKLIALLLAILMVATVALVSCSGNKGTQGGNADDGANTEEDNGLVIPGGVGSSDTTDAGSDTTDTSEGGNNNQNTSGTFVDVAAPFSVYTYVKTNIRKNADIKSNTVVTVEASAQLTVIARNDATEWYKVKYGTDEGYVPYDFVTENKNNTIFTDFNEADYKIVKVKENNTPDADPYKVNIRQHPIFGDNIKDFSQTMKVLTHEQTANGELLKIGANASGTWYKVSYQNEVYYLAITSITKPLLIVGGVELVPPSDDAV